MPERPFTYRPNWGLPSMTPPDQTGAPVFALSRDEVLPGEQVHAVIVTPFPGMVARWHLEAQPGVILPLYEGARICGHGSVLWSTPITRPLTAEVANRFRRWLSDPTTPWGGFKA